MDLNTVTVSINTYLHLLTHIYNRLRVLTLVLHVPYSIIYLNE